MHQKREMLLCKFTSEDQCSCKILTLLQRQRAPKLFLGSAGATRLVWESLQPILQLIFLKTQTHNKVEFREEYLTNLLPRTQTVLVVFSRDLL